MSSVSRTLHLNPRQRRTFISSLFGLTFLASVVTVSASALLPCPVPHQRYADADADGSGAQRMRRAVTVVEKKPRRWIEETRPPRAPPSDNVVDVQP